DAFELFKGVSGIANNEITFHRYGSNAMWHKKMKTCGLLPGWYGLTSQDLLTALQMFQNPDQLQDNWLKDEDSQTAPVNIGPSS
ncbi:hypothetical protein STEG23_012816, partial [Scotinomys teguina]